MSHARALLMAVTVAGAVLFPWGRLANAAHFLMIAP
jgi:hypothetical protein